MKPWKNQHRDYRDVHEFKMDENRHYACIYCGVLFENRYKSCLPERCEAYDVKRKKLMGEWSGKHG